MFEINKKSDEEAPVLKHSDRVFHDALADGKRRYHVCRDFGEDYDIVYTKNFDYVLPMMPESYRYIEVYWDFLKYDESDMTSIVMDQFETRKKVVFQEVNEYTIVIGRILLRERRDIELFYVDERIKWFLPENEHLHVGDDLPEDTEEVLYVTQPLGYSYQNTTGNKISVLAVFQSMFFLQAATDKPLSAIKYIQMQFDSGLIGIGAIGSQTARMESIFKKAGWTAYIVGDYIGKYPRKMIDKFMNIPSKPQDATEDNTLFPDYLLLPRLTVTYTGIRANRVFDISWFKDDFVSQLKEYADGVIGDKKMLGVYIRGTDYITTNMPGLGKQATVGEMIPKIHEWMDMYGFDGIFLATEDSGILKEMRDEFGSLIRIVAQERFSVDEFKTVKLIGELEAEKYDASEKEAHLEDLTVNYFYAMYVLSRCDSFIASGTANGVDIVNCFNNGAFDHYYLFTIGMNK